MKLLMTIAQNCLIAILLSTTSSTYSQVNLDWAFQFGGNAYSGAVQLVLDQNDDIIVVGYFNGSYDFDPGPGVTTLTSQGGNDVFVCKIDPMGDLVWGKTISGPSTQGDYPYDVVSDQNGDIYVAGLFNDSIDLDPGPGTDLHTAIGPTPTTKDDAFIVKLDQNGDFVWGETFGGNYTDVIYSICIDSNNDLLMYGHFRLNNGTDFDPGTGTYTMSDVDWFILKWDENANFIWAKGLDLNSHGTGAYPTIDIDAADNIYIGGYFFDSADFDPGAGTHYKTSEGLLDAYVLKLSSSGDFQWAQTLGGTSSDIIAGLVVDSAGYTYSTGTVMNIVDFDPGPAVSSYTVNSQDTFVWKLTPSGNLASYAVFTGSNDNYGWTITMDAECSLYIAGQLEDSTDFDPGPGTVKLASVGFRDIFITKLDSSLIYQWAKTFGGIVSEGPHGIAVNQNMDVYCTGVFRDTVDFDPNAGVVNVSPITSWDPFIFKLNQCQYIDTTITYLNAYTLQSNSINADYQWVDCNNAFAPISGETNQTYTAAQNGSYAVILEYGSCKDTSNCFVVNSVGIPEINSNRPLKVVEIIDLLGRKTGYETNTVLIYIYEDGTRKKIVRIE